MQIQPELARRLQIPLSQSFYVQSSSFYQWQEENTLTSLVKNKPEIFNQLINWKYLPPRLMHFLSLTCFAGLTATAEAVKLVVNVE